MEEKEEQEEDEDTSRSTTSGDSGSSDDEEEQGLRCSLVVAGQRRCSGLLTATARALRFVPHSDPDHVYEVEYGRVTWAGWQASERGSRGENCGFLHLVLTQSSSPDDGGRSTKSQRGKKKRTKSTGGGGGSVDDLARHTFAHFVAGGPRTARNPRLRALVADIRRLSAVALAVAAAGPTDATTTTTTTTSAAPAAAPSSSSSSSSSSTVIAASSPSPRTLRTRSTVVIGSEGEDDRVVEEEVEEKEEEEEEEEVEGNNEDEAGIRVERIGHRGTEAMHGVVRGGAGMCRVHLTPTAIVQLDRRPFVVVPYREIEVACLERALFKPALRNFDLALVRKSVRQQVSAAKPKPKRKRRATRKSSKKRRRGEDDETEDDDDEDDEDVIGGKNLSRYVAQVHSIPMEYLARLESRLSNEAVPHHRGLGNVQWPPLLNFVRDNPEEFERTGGWAQYLKPEYGESAGGRRRKRGSDDSDDGSEDDDDSSDSEGDLWTMNGGGSGSGVDDEEGESDGEFTPETGLLNASYSEIDADDADSPRSKRKRKRLPGAPADSSSGEKKRSERSPGLAALLLQVSDDEDVHLASMRAKNRKAKAKKTTTTAGDELGDKREKRAKKDKGDDEEPAKKRRRRATTKGDDGKEQAVAKVSSSRRKRKSEDSEEAKSASKKTKKKEKKKKGKNEDCGEKDAKAKADTRTTRCLALDETIIESTDDEFEPKVAKPAAPSSAAESARARNERVRQRRFTGYNTRSRRGATPAGGPQDKIIRIDPPTRRKRTPAPPTAATTPAQSKDLEVSPPKKDILPAMKAEAEVADSAASTQALMLQPTIVAASDDGDESGSCSLSFSFNSGDESTGSALGEAGYESEGSNRLDDSTTAAMSPVATKFPLANIGGVAVGLHQNTQ